MVLGCCGGFDDPILLGRLDGLSDMWFPPRSRLLGSSSNSTVRFACMLRFVFRDIFLENLLYVI
jgi:hypothetical protein